MLFEYQMGCTDVICEEKLHRSLHYPKALRGSRSQSYQRTSGPSVQARKVVATLLQLEHQNANSVKEQVGRDIL